MQRVFIKPAHEDVPVRYPDGRGQLPKEGKKLKLTEGVKRPDLRFFLKGEGCII